MLLLCTVSFSGTNKHGEGGEGCDNVPAGDRAWTEIVLAGYAVFVVLSHNNVSYFGAQDCKFSNDVPNYTCEEGRGE